MRKKILLDKPDVTTTAADGQKQASRDGSNNAVDVNAPKHPIQMNFDDEDSKLLVAVKNSVLVTTPAGQWSQSNTTMSRPLIQYPLGKQSLQHPFISEQS